jgi:hypothetical protein
MARQSQALKRSAAEGKQPEQSPNKKSKPEANTKDKKGSASDKKSKNNLKKVGWKVTRS